MKETNVTIASTNFTNAILKNYKDYTIIDDNFTYEEILNSKKVIFLNILNNLKDSELKKLFEFINRNNILFVNVTNNLETSLYTDYLICYDKDKIIIEGSTLDVLKNDKLLKRFGFKLPFMVELSLLLKDYDLVDKVYLNKEELRRILWK